MNNQEQDDVVLNYAEDMMNHGTPGRIISVPGKIVILASTKVIHGCRNTMNRLLGDVKDEQK